MTSVSNILYAELIVGAIIFNADTEVSIPDIQSISFCKKYTVEYIQRIIKELVGYGIIAPKMNHQVITFFITEFGKYYFAQLSKENSDIQQMVSQIGSELV